MVSSKWLFMDIHSIAFLYLKSLQNVWDFFPFCFLKCRSPDWLNLNARTQKSTFLKEIDI